MARMTADETLKSYLVGAKQITEICDKDGQVLGYYAPAEVERHVPAVRTIRLASLFDPEELKRRKGSTHPGYTTEEVMAYLRSLEQLK